MNTNHHGSAIPKLVFSVLLLFSLASCDNKTEPDTTTTTTPTATDATPASTTTGTAQNAVPLTGYLYDLTLTKTQYLALRNTAKPGGQKSKKMVFQFYFHNTDLPNGPTLIAYAANKVSNGNRFGSNPDPLQGRHTEILGITATPRLNLSTAPVNGQFTLGDQEISFAKIEKDLKPDLRTPSEGGVDFTLFFKPVKYGRNIRYVICLNAACSDPSTPTQPSPPANTQ